MDLEPAQLILASGEAFSGVAPKEQADCYGEVVFNTGMVGYVESLTDPSYAGQILVFTYPLIGNYGVPDPKTWESKKIHVKGAVFSSLAEHASNFTSLQSLKNWLTQSEIPFIVGVDTRAVTIRLREKGVIPGAILAKDTQPQVFEDFSAINWVKKVSITEPEYYGEGEKLIIAVDCGMKQNIIRRLLALGVRIKRVPYNYDYSGEEFDGVFLSNGPGDPRHCEETIAVIRKILPLKKPIFGICLGTQLLALACGAQTYKLPFGHRSHNQPCMDFETQRCYLTSQNHSYAVDEKTLPADWRVTFRNLNDGSCEGIAHNELPYFAVQFHPEAAPGPMDTQWLFQKFYHAIVRETSQVIHAF